MHVMKLSFLFVCFFFLFPFKIGSGCYSRCKSKVKKKKYSLWSLIKSWNESNKHPKVYASETGSIAIITTWTYQQEWAPGVQFLCVVIIFCWCRRVIFLRSCCEIKRNNSIIAVDIYWYQLSTCFFVLQFPFGFIFQLCCKCV